ncbi:MAG: NCS2 family permease [Opitutales bacterium]|nr:NCS2 family permease [Opitutales bacterium]
MKWLDQLFNISSQGSTVRKELLAGIATFAAMSYILVVNPSILGEAGMPREALITVTAIAAAFGCFLMAAMTNYPIALAPGMGTNSYFAFVICLGMGVRWQDALALTFWNGLVFLILSVTGLRKKIAASLPNGLKVGIQVGIGFFIAFIGLKNVGIVVNHDATLVAVGSLKSPASILVVIGVILMTVLSVKKFPGAILFSILGITALGFFVTSGGSAITATPSGVVSAPAGIGETFMQLNILFPFQNLAAALPIILTLLILDLFDSIGTLVGLSRRAKLLDENGNMPGMGKALTADSIATMGGALLGTSTTTSYVESAVGIESGGKTGLTAVACGICFLLALIFTPILTIVPAVATAPALVMVGVFMAQGLKELNFDDLSEVAPAFITMLMIPLTFSITEGIGIGLVVFVFVMILLNRMKEVPIFSYLVAALFLVYYGLK